MANFRLELEKTIVMLDFTTFNLLKCNISCKKNFFKFRTKFILFWYFWARIWKQYCHIWNQHLRVCQTAKFREKMKIPRFVTKNVLFGYFWVRILKKYCHIWNLEFENNIVIFEIRTREISWNNENAYVWKWKCLNWALKMPCLGIFRLKF